MRTILSILIVTVLAATVLFSGCSNRNVIATTEASTAESVTEAIEISTTESVTEATEISTTEPQNMAKLPEYNCNETQIPKEIMEAAQNCTEYEIGAYLYGDIDMDSENELLAAYIDPEALQWNIILLENKPSKAREFFSIKLDMDYDRCSLGLIGLEDKVHYVVNLSSSFGTANAGYIFEEGDDGVNEIIRIFKAICQTEKGEIIVQNTSYGACMDKTTGMMMGRVWTYSYLTYDYDSETYKEYVAKEIRQEEFLAYEGAADVKNTVEDTYKDKNVKITYFRRSNGFMYIQCECDEDDMIYYDYCTMLYDGNRITDKTDMQQGVVEKKATILEEI